MTEYISREEVLDNAEYTENFNLVVPVRLIKAIPKADVQPVKCGEWVYSDIPIFGNPYGRYLCSMCDFPMDEKDYNYCPNCGADMRNKEG